MNNISQSKLCKQCGNDFTIIEGDLEFYKKVSPIYNNTIYTISSPSYCEECRMVQLMSWRNERKLHSRECSLCKKQIISVFSEEKKLNVLCSDCYWSDRWDALKQGVDINFSESFFSQFVGLMKRTKLLALFATHNVNCEYVNQETDDNNCYLCVGGNTNTDCYYCTYALFSKNCIDCLGITMGENLYYCTFCISCYGSQYLFNCNICRDCYFCEDCIGCANCFGSINLRYKKFYFFNKQLPRDEYFEKVKKYLDSYDGIQKAQEEFKRHRLNYVFRFIKMILCQNDCTGDNLFQCKNVKKGFYSVAAENAQNIFLVNKVKEVKDSVATGRGELVYYSGSSPGLFCAAFCTSCFDLRNSYYCFMCTNSHDLFGCVGLNHKEYCILNKQYSKEDYAEFLPKVIKHLAESGEWGNFPPLSSSPFGYNETMAQEYYPITKSKAKKIKANWEDKVPAVQYNSPFYEPKNIAEYHLDNNPDAEKEIEACLHGVITCEVSGKPFHLISQELADYMNKGIQIPRKHPDERHKERLALLDKMKLYHRKCMNEGCDNEFETTYAPDRPEKVYCESCYQKAVI